MKKRLLPLVLSLLLMAGCTPPPEHSPSPTPEPDPTPVAGMDFDAFLEEVNETRRSSLMQVSNIDLTPYTPEYADEMGTFSQEEMDRLLTPHELEAPLTLETAQEDVDTFFTLLRTTYGPYWYFGGDETFLPIREQVMAALEEEAEGHILLSQTLQDLLADALSPVLQDGHFTIGTRRVNQDRKMYTYYVPGLYLSDAEGLDPDYVKPTIGPEGQICYGFYALSHDGTDLPDTLGGYDLSWQPCTIGGRPDSMVFKETEYQGIPVLVSRRMEAATPEQEQQLEQFQSCGQDYQDVPLLCFDVRSNPGGYSTYGMEWFRGFTGAYPDRCEIFIRKYGDLAREVSRRFALEHPDDSPVELPEPGQWHLSVSEGTWHNREGVTFVLMDRGTASAGEDMVTNFRTVDNSLFVGTNTSGCYLGASNNTYYLPNTGLPVYMAQAVDMVGGTENRDGTGFLPDLWVNPPDALDAVARLCDYYGLK